MTKETSAASQAGAVGISRNAPCPCGSGERYKRCCGAHSRPNGAPPDPQVAQKLFRRGVELLRAGQLAAIPTLHEAIRTDPAYFEAHHALASALMRSGRFADAVAVLLRALTLRSDSAPAWRDLGFSYDRQNQHPQAIEAYRRAVELTPNLGDVLYRLGELYTMYSRLNEAADCYERAADIMPDSTKGRLLRSDASLLRGDMSAAEEWARKAVALDGTNDATHGTLGGLLYAQGRFEEAAASFETAVGLNPKAARCWHGLAECRTFSEADNAMVERLRAAVGRGDLNDYERMTLHFALGKTYDDRGDYAGAMEQFDAANGLRAKDLRFDRSAFEVLVDRTIQRFTTDFMKANASLGTRDPKPLFIVGMYRSGTTLVEQILSSHPEIAAGGELTVWTPTEIDVDPATGEFDPGCVQAAVAKYLAALQRIGPSAARVTDKMPFNFFRLGAIHTLMPNARIIHCRRDPIDTCLSIYTNLFKSRVPFAARKDDLVFCYRLYQRIMDHWRKVLPAEILLDVQYEQLILDREAETRRLIAITGLPWNDSCLQPEQNIRSIDTASARQARQPVYASSVQRWRQYEPWLGELRELLPADARDG